MAEVTKTFFYCDWCGLEAEGRERATFGSGMRDAPPDDWRYFTRPQSGHDLLCSPCQHACINAYESAKARRGKENKKS